MRRRAFDFVLAGMVLAFAFLASSFAVRNSDFWIHLAAGRLLAEGRYQFGVDPFAFTTANHYWANHAWLFDVLSYLLYTSFGGAALVVGKALLITFLAAILLRLRRLQSGRGWPAACTLLAVLAMSPRLLLHSTCLSFVLLGLTLWLLERRRGQGDTWRSQGRHYLPLLLLFVLWVNVDDWFWLGPMLAMLFWVGDGLAPPREVGEGMQRTPGWLGPLGLAACLVNPHHFHAFTLPTELLPLPEALRHDVRFDALRASPWRMALYYHPHAGVNVANAAYLVLLAVGALSFLLNSRHLVGWRLMVWLTFAGLSAWLARTVPFFAVVAAPITALNVQDALARRQAAANSSRRFLRNAAYAFLALSCLALMGLAWPGWLQGFQDGGRHVDWAVREDGSLRRVAEKLRHWRQSGKLPAASRGFLSHWGVAHYCAWFCPEEKAFLDPRFALFGDVADEYEQICRAANLIPDRKKGQPTGDWRALLRAHAITHLVVYDPSLARLLPVLGQLADDKNAWTLLDIDGQALILGWRDGVRVLPSGVPLFDADRAAFTDDEAMIPAAPGRGPGRGPRPGDAWSNFAKPMLLSPWQTEAAGVLLYYFEARAPRERQKRAPRCIGWAAAMMGLPALSAGGPDALWRLAVSIAQAPSAPQDVEQQPPALPLLAVRAARGALAENPEDASAYLCLGRAYLDLVSQTPERTVLGLLQPMTELRHIQIVSALENSLRRKPDALPAHEVLAGLYEGRGFLDAALDHRRQVARLTRQAGPGTDPADFARRLEQMDNAVKKLERRVGDLRNEFRLRTQTLGSEPMRKAELALRMGLARLALEDVLMTASPVLLASEGVCLQVRLQLMLGRIDVVRPQLHDPDWQTHGANLGFVTLSEAGNSASTPYRLRAYEWFLLCQTAADGDYEEAEAVLKTFLDIPPEQRAALAVRELESTLPRMLALEMALSANPRPGFAQSLAHLQRSEATQLLRMVSVQAKEQARMQGDLQVLAGMLALERGQPRAAESSFQRVLAVRRPGDETLPDPAVLLAEAYLRLLHAARR